MHRGVPGRPDIRRAEDEQAGPVEAAAKPAEAAPRRSLAARFSGLMTMRVRLPGRTFAAVTVAPVVLAVAWLLPGTGLLLAGRLFAGPTVIIFVPLAVAIFDFVLGRLPVSWPRFNEAEPGAAPVAAPRRRDVSGVALLAMLVIAAGFGAWQAFFRSEQIFVTSDPGVYLQYGYWIAEHGTARIPDSAAAFGGAQGLHFATTGFAAAGGSVTPAGMPGLPLVLAAGTWLYGLPGALLVPAVLGGCALLSFGGLLGRLCGGWWAVAGELVLAVGLPEVYTSRAPFSEPLVQVLLFGGLCLFIDSLVMRRRVLAGLGGLALGLTVLASIASLGVLLPVFPVLAALLVAKRPEAGPFGVGLVLGLGTGLAAGMVLARAYLSTVSAQLHLIGLCAFDCCAVTALVLTLGVPAVRSWLRRVFGYQVRVIGFRGQVSLLPSLAHLVQALALVLPAVVLVGLAERPFVQTVRGQTDPSMIRAVAALQRLERLPVDGLRQYYESSLHWVWWYLGAPALLLACAGAAALGGRSVEAGFRRLSRAETEDADAVTAAGAKTAGATADDYAADSYAYADDAMTTAGAVTSVDAVPAAGVVPAADAVTTAAAVPAASARADVPVSVVLLWALPFLIFAWSVVTVLWDPAVVPWQPMASHRLVPVVLPGLVLLGVWMSSWLTSRASAFGASRTALAVVGACCVLALTVPPLVTTLNPFLTSPAASSSAASSDSSASGRVSQFLSRVQLRGVGASRTYGGSIAAASALCAAIGPSASVLVTDGSTAATFGPVIRGMCGQPVALVVPGPSAAAFAAELEQAVSAVEQAGRRPVLLGPSRSSVSLPGAQPQQAVSLHTAGDAESLTGAPTGTWPVSYSAWLAVPADAGG